ncbi:MAG: 30S ribosomal protein S16 [Longimicrobiales bacterium]
MSVRIRLRRVGRKKQPSYRVVIADRRAARDGAYLESIGFYNPRRQPAELKLDLERVEYWLERGAEPSTTVVSLIRKARKGGDEKVALVRDVPAAPVAEPAARRRQRGGPEPTAETEAKADPEIGNQANAGAASPTERKKAPRAGSRGRGAAEVDAAAAGQAGAVGAGPLGTSGDAGEAAKPAAGTEAAERIREAGEGAES